MKKGILYYLFITLFTIVTLSANDKKIVIVATNDMHGRIQQFNQLSGLVNMLRSQNENVMVVNAGDMFSGNPYVDKDINKGKPIIDLMNLIGYDVTSVGNHEFDYGQKIFAARIQDASFPFLCANIKLINGNDTLNAIKPYFIKEIDGLKICFLSLLYLRDGEPETHVKNRLNIEFTDPLKAAQNYKQLRDSCNLFIGLTHLGLGIDTLLAKQMPELDLIIGGHSHDLIDKPLIVNGVVITQTGSFMKNIGVISIDFEDGKVESIKNVIFKLSDKKVDSILKKTEENNSHLKTPVAKLKIDLADKEKLGNLMTDGIRWATGTDIAIQNQGGVRLNSFPSGEILIADLYTLDPFGNDIIIHKMTLEDLKKLILWKFNEPEKQNESYHSIDLFISGINYNIITDKNKEGKNVIFYSDEGKKLKDHSSITVAMNSYINTAYNFNGKGGGNSFGKSTVDVLIDYLSSKKEITSDGGNRTKIIIENK